MEDKKYSKLKAAFEATQPQVPADFTERVMKRIEEQPSVFQSKRRRVWQYPIIAVVAAIALLLYIGVNPNDQKPEHPILIVQTDTVRTVPQTKVEMVDSLKAVKEILQISKPPKHYMARQEIKAESHAETEVIDASDFVERAMAEENQRFAMEMMAAMNGSLQTDFQEMAKEIRQRGERMSQKMEMAINDNEY